MEYGRLVIRKVEQAIHKNFKKRKYNKKEIIKQVPSVKEAKAKHIIAYVRACARTCFCYAFANSRCECRSRIRF